ncbi:hydantoinase B/oxoprolinase family protein [Paenibacillus sp. GCM10027626]|uniref:hydantoinase B/oxoprolinase family protein n=1 Tax=Paenibacillus sp. GCM10027626 TaxID=3273411 RepID=UPI00363A25B3
MIEAQIFYGKLQAVCRETGNNLYRNSRSALLARDRSFAVGVMTGEQELAAQVQYDPDHLFALRESTRSLFEYFSYDISEGDVLLTADPYRGGTQGQTLTMAAPYFHDGEIVLYPVIRAQMTDLAGEYPGGYHAEAFELWQESMRLSPVKLYKGGVLQRDVLRFLLANSRVPTLFAADLRAMQACCLAAQNRLGELIEQHGPERLKQHLHEMFDYNANRVARQFERFPAVSNTGRAEFVAGSSGQVEIAVTLRRDPADGGITFDFAGTGAQVEGPYNVTTAAAAAYAAWPVLAPVYEELSINEGTLRAFRLCAEKGSLVNPTFPAATALSRAVTGHYIAKAVADALKGECAGEAEFAYQIHGPGPQAILYEPVGTKAEIEPLFLTPGFAAAAGGWGPPGLNGESLLVSAEELEMHYGFQLLKREGEAGSGMTVEMINRKGLLHMNVIVPKETGGSAGSIETGSKVYVQSANGVELKTEERLTFRYPGKEGESHGTC